MIDGQNFLRETKIKNFPVHAKERKRERGGGERERAQ